ncbi:sugar transferase [Deinococcus sp. Marseille-Q6407]|uniref:sugar transferase n=1 Tax=Deinococcus sp. Marseille-Q6407 TaxID=2969223 RepID=UPI0028FC1E88|nr:sugar transferase [Deinococcus sp. Marseille-Q6407]
MPRTDRSIFFAVTASISLGFLRGQVRLLRDRGWRAGVGSAPTVPGQLERFARQEGAQAYAVPMQREISPLSDLRSLWQMYRTLRHFRPAVTNVGTPKAGLIGGMAAVAARVPVRVYTLHGLRLETADGTKRRILNLTERVAMACAHQVVCVSPSLQQRVQELKLAPAYKTRVLGSGSPNGVRLPEALPTVEETEQRQNELELQGPVVGFVGRFVRDKGMAELMEAFQLVRQQVPAAQLLLVGDFEEGDPVPAQVREAIESVPGVVKTGFVPDVGFYYPMMDVLALPTYREGFPTVALEALAWGVPVVTTNATGARDAVQDGVTGWQVPVGDAQALAAALLEAITNPKEAHRRGAAGRRWVAASFRPEDIQQRWAELYEELLYHRQLAAKDPAKRWLDAALAASGLLVLSGPMLLLALAIRSKLGSPVIFRQVRPGLGGQPFTMYKFRTMTDERGPDGELLSDSVRLTPFGRFLRSTSLDELPELFNVFRGEMSLVGPRPLLMDYLPLYSSQQARRHEVRPGVTGWAQVNGRNAISWDQKFKYDVWYVDHHNLLLDLKILLLTLKKVFVREGISAAGEATMSRFTGSSA